MLKLKRRDSQIMLDLRGQPFYLLRLIISSDLIRCHLQPCLWCPGYLLPHFSNTLELSNLESQFIQLAGAGSLSKTWELVHYNFLLIVITNVRAFFSPFQPQPVGEQPWTKCQAPWSLLTLVPAVKHFRKNRPFKFYCFYSLAYFAKLCGVESHQSFKRE